MVSKKVRLPCSPGRAAASGGSADLSPGPWVPALPGHESQGSWPGPGGGPGFCACGCGPAGQWAATAVSGPGGALSQKSDAAPWGTGSALPRTTAGHQALCPWELNTGVGLHFLTQRIVLTQELNLGLCVSCLAGRLCHEHHVKPKLEAQPTPLPQSIGVNRFNSHREANRTLK